MDVRNKGIYCYMSDAKKQKHNLPSKAERPASTPRVEVVKPVATFTSVYEQEVHERAEMITPFLAEILRKPVSSHWGINE